MIEGLFQPAHLILILVIVLIVFGPGKLPEIGSALGKSIREFRDSTKDNPTQAQVAAKDEVTEKPASPAAPTSTTNTTTTSPNKTV